MQYQFTLKDDNQNSFGLFVWFLFFIHVVAAALFAVKTTSVNMRLSMFILLGFYLMISTGYFFFKKHKKALETFSLIGALLYANFWFSYVSGIALLIFVVIYVFATLVQGKKSTVLFSEKGIALVRVFKTTRYRWQDLENSILKDDILTIDFKSNKIIQAEIVEGNTSIDEKNFNLFCTQQLQNSD